MLTIIIAMIIQLLSGYSDYKKRKVQRAEIKEELMSIAWHPVRMQDWCMTEGGKKKKDYGDACLGMVKASDSCF